MSEMTSETFKKFQSRFQEEKHQIVTNLHNCSLSISNLKESIFEIVHFTAKLNTVWTCSNIHGKETLQNLIFPEGVYYDRQNDTFRTPKVNFIFELIQRQISNTDENGNATSHLSDNLSHSAERRGQVSNLFVKDLIKIAEFVAQFGLIRKWCSLICNIVN